MIVLAPDLPVLGNHPDFPGHRLVVGEHRPGIAPGTEVLARIKAVGSDLAKGTNRTTIEARTVSLRAILEDEEMVPFRDAHHLVHVHWQAVEVDWNDGLCPGCDLRRSVVEIDRVGPRRDVDEHRRRAW